MNNSRISKVEIIEKLNRVTDKLLKLELPENEAELQNLGEDAGRRGYFARDFGMEEWDLPQGVGLYGLQKLEQHFKDERYQEYAKLWMSKQLGKGLPSRNINTTAPLLSLMELKEAEELSMEWVQWLMHERCRGRRSLVISMSQQERARMKLRSMIMKSGLIRYLWLFCSRQKWV